MNEHRFVLQPYRGPGSRFRCPQCQHRNKTFTRYIDLETHTYLADHVGRCNREEKCGYHYSPRDYFADNPYTGASPKTKLREAMPVKGIFNHLPASLMHDTMVHTAYAHNNFMFFLAWMFDWETALEAAKKYNIGTASYWPGATVFWQVDKDFKIRTGKIMLYDKGTGKRVKTPFSHIAWVHRVVGKSESRKSRKEAAPAISTGGGMTENVPAHLSDFRTFGLSDFLLEQCFFGEHLLSQDLNAVVAIAESEKTAVMASIMMPDFIWLAAGALNGLDPHKCRVLKNRRVLLFPDVGAYGNWLACARSLNLKIPTATFTVHDEMERTATDEERANGADMADRWVAEWIEMQVLKHD